MPFDGTNFYRKPQRPRRTRWAYIGPVGSLITFGLAAESITQSPPRLGAAIGFLVGCVASWCAGVMIYNWNNTPKQ